MYVFAIAAAASGGLIGPWMQKVEAALEASPDDEPSERLAALLRDRKPRAGTLITAVAIISAVYVMSVKPL